MKRKDLKIALFVIVALLVVTIIFGYIILRQKRLIKEEKVQISTLRQDLTDKELYIDNFKNGQDRAFNKRRGLRIEIAKLEGRIRELEEQLAQKDNQSQEAQLKVAASEEELFVEESSADTEVEEPSSEMDGTEKLAENMMEIPGMNMIIRQQQKNELDMVYGNFYKQLWLNKNEIKTLQGLMLDKQMNEIELGMKYMAVDANDKEQRQAIAETIKEEQKEFDNEIKELLGEEQFANYQEYSKTYSQRMVLSRSQKRLAVNGIEPLVDYQENQLIQIMVEERENFPFSTNSFPSTEEAVDRLFQEAEECNKNIIEKTRPFFTEEQISAFSAALEEQLKLEKFQMVMAVKMTSSKKKENSAATSADTATETIE